MRVLIASPEIVPFVKTGGLADVAGALSKALRRIGVEADCVLPLYRGLDRQGFPLSQSGASIRVAVGHREESGAVLETDAETGVRTFLVRNDRYFDRESIYGTKDGDYPDNCERFAFFCKAVMEWIARSGRHYEVIHCNEWQTGLIPAYVKTLHSNEDAFRSTGTVMTLHNIGYQGLFPAHDLPLTGLGRDLFTPQGIEFFGRISLLKAGLVFADLLSTVSRTYSREIQTAECGYGLEGILSARREDLFGILNGLDYDEWNPKTDALIAAPYSKYLLSGKRTCRTDLLAEMGWTDSYVGPVIGFVGRLTDQKGLDLLDQIGDWLAQQHVRLVVLGTGARRYEESMADLARRHPGKISIRLGFDNRLAHKIQAGADIFLMPSHYEPCGLTQIQSLRYGTVPVVRNTGGLADTVVDADEDPSRGTGFKFNRYEAGELIGAIWRAFAAYGNRRRWKAIVRRGMAKDFSWDASAREYVALYEKAVQKRELRHNMTEVRP